MSRHLRDNRNGNDCRRVANETKWRTLTQAFKKRRGLRRCQRSHIRHSCCIRRELARHVGHHDEICHPLTPCRRAPRRAVPAHGRVSSPASAWNGCPYDSAKVHAPRWVIAICGLVFVAGGLAMLRVTWARSAQAQSQPIFGVAILLGIAVVATWVAFGDGERRFTRTTSINDVVVDSRPLDERSGRFVFGISAVILDLVLVALVVKHLRKRSG